MVSICAWLKKSIEEGVLLTLSDITKQAGFSRDVIQLKSNASLINETDLHSPMVSTGNGMTELTESRDFFPPMESSRLPGTQVTSDSCRSFFWKNAVNSISRRCNLVS